MTQLILFDSPPAHTLSERAPRQSHSPTSVRAASQITPHLGRLQNAVLAYIREHGPVSDNEIIAGMNGNPSSLRPRRVELQRHGLIAAVGERNGSTLWQVKE